MSKPHVVILGAGPAGVGAAYRLRTTDRATVTLIEQQGTVGGNAGSIDLAGQRVDYGSHRLHPSCDTTILSDIRAMLGSDLLDRPRHGRIRLRGRWIHFPLKPVDLLLRLDPTFALSSLADALLKPMRGHGTDESFAGVLQGSLGPTICRDFYFPYARKIWGRAPEELSAIQARRRVSASSFGKLLRKVAGQVPGLRRPGAGRFFYPRRGFGQISEAYADAARSLGAETLLRHRVTGLTPPGTDGDRWRVTAEGPDGEVHRSADHVWSTIPVTVLARCMNGGVPPEVLDAGSALHYRAMLLIYLEIPTERFSEYDAHYFPGSDTVMTRMSEPKNYAARSEPAGRTILCAELPCAIDDTHWKMSDEELGAVVARDLEAAGVPLPAPPTAVHTRRLGQAYPIYLTGYERPFEVLDRWATSVPRLLSFGRQGLFAHDNTHHALAMAYAAVECLTGTGFDAERWQAYRETFTHHVVED